MKNGGFGLESNGLPEFDGRYGVISLDVAKDVAKGVVGIREVGLDADGLAVLGHCLVELPPLRE